MIEDLPADTIIDLSQPGVIHYIYPNGRKPGLIDPNIGGWFQATEPVENSPE